MAITKVKLNLNLMPIPVKIQKSREIVTQMTGNANFTTPNPALSVITSKANTLETSYNTAQNARYIAKAKTALQDADEAALDLVLSQEANYVEIASAGNDAKILSSGMDLRNPKQPVGEMPQVENLSAHTGDNDGEIDLNWDAVKKRKTYVVESSVDTPSLWKQEGTPTKSKMTVGGLISGKKYWFRVAAIGTSGRGAWSEPAYKVAP